MVPDEFQRGLIYSEALRSPYLAQLGPSGGSDNPWYDEFYNDFDMRKDRSQSSVLTVSYGEYVPSPDLVDVDGVVARAEDRARSYLEVVGAADEQLRIVRRDWNCLETGKSAKPFLAHIDLLFSDSATQAGPRTEDRGLRTKDQGRTKNQAPRTKD